MKLGRRRMILMRNRAVPITYLLQDEFSDTVAAGSVNGSHAIDGSLRTSVDGNSKLGIGLGFAGFTTGGVAGGNPGMWYPTVVRVAGKVLVSKVVGTNSSYAVGFDTNTSGAAIWSIVFGTSIRVGTYNGPAPFCDSVPAQNSNVYTATVVRTAGALHFVKEATAYPNWILLYTDYNGTESPIYPALQGGVATPFNVDFVRMPTNIIKITPLASDAFTRTNGLLGNTGGGGASETGGDGLAWTSQLGTWGVATNKAVCSALDGGASLGVATVPCGTPNILAEMVPTKTAGTCGFVLRYTDSSNYIKCVLNATNLIVTEVVGGTPNILINAAVTYGSTKRMVVSLNGATAIAYYNDAQVGTHSTAITTGNNHGLFTDDTGATFDNFVIWAKGNEGQYSALNPFISASPNPKPPIVLTYDDGRQSIYDNVFPYLVSKGVKGTAYIISDNIGVGSSMSAANIQALFAAGWTVGNHTKDHPDLSTLTEAQQETELSTCQSVLFGLGITTENYVAYPLGGNNANTITAMTNLGMLTGRTVVGGSFNLPLSGNKFLVNGNDVSSSTLAVTKVLVDVAISRGQALVLLIHNVVASPGAGDWSISDFQALVDYILAKGCPMKTMADLYAML